MTTPPDPMVLATAQAKAAQGRGLKNSEISALKAFARIQIMPPSQRPKPNQITVYDTSSNMLAGKDTLSAQAGVGGGADIAALEARVAALEALLAGFVERDLEVCDGGVSVEYAFLTKS